MAGARSPRAGRIMRPALGYPSQWVEMGGVEPPSRNFRDGYATGIVETLCFAAGTVLDYLPWTLVG